MTGAGWIKIFIMLLFNKLLNLWDLVDSFIVFCPLFALAKNREK
jgi:hypothetical protein